MSRLAVLFVLSAASSPCPDLNLTHYKRPSETSFQTAFIYFNLNQNKP
ncbi:hypothetical protein NEIFLAOT_01034 [Neisseria flavescens NRL30031/H210]|uniref:Uncharacterized protein n=1 Tax=Neisseria flavescens NRL30031/H210 TaxID=546264 RepID=C0EM68_NEIFL|nr:hypothetical protein NEIFLAOT_01034 [Neisseria flavescens NRL30031/H210]